MKRVVTGRTVFLVPQNNAILSAEAFAPGRYDVEASSSGSKLSRRQRRKRSLELRAQHLLLVQPAARPTVEPTVSVSTQNWFDNLKWVKQDSSTGQLKAILCEVALSIGLFGGLGKVAVIGGCREYTGAPYFAAISALKIGADLSHVFCTRDAAAVIKCYSPELIVHPVLEESYSVRDEEIAMVSAKVLGEVKKWMERFDCIVVGPGLGRDPFLLNCVSDIMRHARDANIPTVIDGDGLFLVTNNLDLVKGNSLAILTPNVNEYKRLLEKVLQSEVNDQNASEQLASLARSIGGVTILRKGKTDLICDGLTVNEVSILGSPRRCGGQGDILSGSVAVFSSWAHHYLSTLKNENGTPSSLNPMVLGSISGSALLRKAASLAFEKKKRSTLTTDIIECLGKSLEDICPAYLSYYNISKGKEIGGF